MSQLSKLAWFKESDIGKTLRPIIKIGAVLDKQSC